MLRSGVSGAMVSPSASVAGHTRMDRLDRQRLRSTKMERKAGNGRWQGERKESGIDVTIDHKIADLFIHHHATRRDVKSRPVAR